MWTYRNAGWTLHAISHAQPQLLVWMPEDRAAGAASIEVFRLPDSINLLEFGLTVPGSAMGPCERVVRKHVLLDIGRHQQCLKDFIGHILETVS